MSQDICIDIEELERFINVLNKFHEQTHERLGAVRAAWEPCSETWQGQAKEEFAQGYEQTEQSVRRALEAGVDAIQWLSRYHEILQEMNGGR
jgi:WXG100 family type VII secretion target